MCSFRLPQFCHLLPIGAAVITFSFASHAVGETRELVYSFSHLTGAPGGAGCADGIGPLASFHGPSSVAVDKTGNVYVADTYNGTIRKITTTGVVTTLAGAAGTFGSADGTGGAARFLEPRGIAVDSAQNVYVADASSNTIRKITPDGVVTTLAGTAYSTGIADGIGPAAQFSRPNGVAVDSAQNVYVADTYNNTIRKITPDGAVTTLAGTAGIFGNTDGSGPAAQFDHPTGLTVDGNGNVYVTDERGDQIRKISPVGKVSTLAGGTVAPSSAAVDSAGNLYMTGAQIIGKITSDGAFSVFAGAVNQAGSADGNGSAARFNLPNGVAVDGAGNVYVADFFNNEIRKITSNGVVSTFAGRTANNSGTADSKGITAQFRAPWGTAVDSVGNIYVSDSVNFTIRKITPTGSVTTFAGVAGQSGDSDGAGDSARFGFPAGVAIDKLGNVYVADRFVHDFNNIADGAVRKITPDRVVTTLAHLGAQPAGIALDASGNVYVAIPGLGFRGVAGTVEKVTPDGVVTKFAGSDWPAGSADGLGAAAQFGSTGPTGIATDSTGNVYVVDSDNSTIRKITPSGSVTTFAGAAGQTGSIDGAGSVARFNNPTGIAVDEPGNVYVEDNDTIRKITPAGVVSTIAGAPGQLGSVDGIGTAARFNNPTGIAVDSAGTLYLADSGSDTMRKGVLIGDAQLVNLSTRSFVSTGDGVQIAGFVIDGSQPKQVLVRACGPVLATAFKLTGVLADPVLRLFNQAGTQINQNAGWGGAVEIAAAAQRVGAFAWPTDSADAALLVTLLPGVYTAQVAGKSGDTGTALIEVYDADTSGSGRLVNLSTRSPVSTGNNLQIGGFVITGNHAKQVLIRACGPVLGTAFKMTGVLTDPVLTLFDHTGTQIDQNTAWGIDVFAANLVRTTAARVGAFTWPDNSADSALLVTLSPGVYTAQVTGKSGDSGTALLEVYDADP